MEAFKEGKAEIAGERKLVYIPPSSPCSLTGSNTVFWTKLYG